MASETERRWYEIGRQAIAERDEARKQLAAANARGAELHDALRTMAQSWLTLAAAFEGPATPYCDGKAEALKLCAADLARTFDAALVGDAGGKE